MSLYKYISGKGRVHSYKKTIIINEQFIKQYYLPFYRNNDYVFKININFFMYRTYISNLIYL